MPDLKTALTLALAGLFVTGLASIIGIWMERDSSRPRKWAMVLSTLILVATSVSMMNSIYEVERSLRLEDDIARMLQSLDGIATESDGSNVMLNEFIATELNAQSRANPDIIERLQTRVANDGGDANAMLGKHMEPSNVPGHVEVDAEAMRGASSQVEAEFVAQECSRESDEAREAALEQGVAARSELERAQRELGEAEAQIEELEARVEQLEQPDQRTPPESPGPRPELERTPPATKSTKPKVPDEQAGDLGESANTTLGSGVEAPRNLGPVPIQRPSNRGSAHSPTSGR